MRNFDYRWVERAAKMMYDDNPGVWKSEEDAWLHLNHWMTEMQRSGNVAHASGGWELQMEVDEADGVPFTVWRLNKECLAWYEGPDVDLEDMEYSGYDFDTVLDKPEQDVLDSE